MSFLQLLFAVWLSSVFYRLLTLSHGCAHACVYMCLYASLTGSFMGVKASPLAWLPHKLSLARSCESPLLPSPLPFSAPPALTLLLVRSTFHLSLSLKPNPTVNELTTDFSGPPFTAL